MILHSGEPGKKTFMHFSSEAGKGFIISDDEEVTGVISVRNHAGNKSSKKKAIFQSSDTKTDTLQKRAKRKQTKKKNVPNFLFVNKPHYSSNSSVEIAPDNGPSEYIQEEQRRDEPKTRDRRYRSELMLSTQCRLVAVFNVLIQACNLICTIFC